MAKPRSRPSRGTPRDNSKGHWEQPPRKGDEKVPAKQAPAENLLREFENAIATAAGHKERYVLRLYVTGSSPRSLSAIGNIRRLCDEYLQGRYDLEVVDIYQQPVLA